MIVVTGAAGVMGSALVRKLRSQGFAVRALVLPDDPCVSRIADCGAEIVEGNIEQPSSIVHLCKGAETVIHCAAIIISSDKTAFDRINVNGTAAVINEAKHSSVKHVIYVSSASVIYPRPTPYSLSKKKSEQIVMDSGIPYTIIRPTLVYDRFSGGLEFDMFLSYLLKFPVVPFIGAGAALKRPVFVEDIINGLAACAALPAAPCKTYNFSGRDAITIREFARLCLSLAGFKNRPIVSVPVCLCQVIAFIMSLIMKHPPLSWQVIGGIIQDANLDPASAIKDLGYCPSSVYTMLPQCFPRKSRSNV
jgi:NADH dehydrogenase